MCTGNRGKSSRVSSLQIFVYQTRGHTGPASRDNWASTQLVRFLHYTCEEGGIVVLERGEKSPYRHPILETGSSILWKVLCPWRTCRETLRKHFSPGTIQNWASKSNLAKSTVINGGGCFESGSSMTILMSLFTDSKCSFGDIRTFRRATRSRCFPVELPRTSYANTAPPRCLVYRRLKYYLLCCAP